ncbi:hypothetical protein [Methylobacterium oryzisoli]
MGSAMRIRSTVSLTWHTTLRVARVMPFGLGFALAVEIAWFFLQQALRGPDGGVSGRLALVPAAEAILLTPFGLAVTRFALLGRPEALREILAQRERLSLALAWSIAWALPFMLYLRLASSMSPLSLALASVAAFLLLTILHVRLCTVAPAIAIDDPGLSLSGAFAATRGHFWSLALLTLTVMLPLIGAALIGPLLLAGLARLFGVDGPLLTAVLEGSLSAIGLTAGCVMQAEIYRLLGAGRTT